MNVSCMAILTRQQAIARLAEKGIKQDENLTLYCCEFCRCFLPVADDGYIENENWPIEPSVSKGKKKSTHH